MSLHKPGGREYTQHVKSDFGRLVASGVGFDILGNIIACIG